MSGRDLQRLRAGTWLNDEIITFYSSLINERARPVRDGEKVQGELKLLKAFCFSSFWYGKLSQEGWTKPLSRWTKKVSGDRTSFRSEIKAADLDPLGFCRCRTSSISTL